ncbi:MAG: XdhC family protein [Rhodobiaceae bacterium]|nr:XdhC family protein [Rhodobiaceae bacterium]MCC0055848.1 XdhC family protein [Rhodobiaceae bacterium]
MDRAILDALGVERRARRAAFVITPLGDGEPRLVKAAEIAGDPDAERLATALRDGRSRLIEDDRGARFIDAHIPEARLVVIGAVHISQMLYPMAIAAGYDVTIIDPRTAFATPERFAGVKLVEKWPQEVLGEAGLDSHSAVVALTHDPKIDDPALIAALRADCFYIGALGSRKTHGRRVERLAAEGFSDTDIGKIHAPVGLDIGAVSPAEIAIAILAEITAVRRKGPGA